MTPVARLPAKLHRRVCLVLTEDAVLAELLSRKLAAEVAGRLSDRALARPPRPTGCRVGRVAEDGSHPASRRPLTPYNV
ncbi:MAG: hypothetical protein U0871_10730 [Gemmataceae bacterium]